MDNDINREVNIEQVEFGIDIDNIEYSIEIMPTPSFEISLNEQGPQGARGYTGNGIESYVKTSSSGLTDTYTITFTDGNTTTVNVTNGRGITSITGPVSVANVDTYTINYNDNTTSTFTVTNGIDGVDGQSAEIVGITASVDNNVGTPSVVATEGGTSLARTFDFAFYNLKGEPGQDGTDGTDGTDGVDGFSPIATVTQTVSGATISITDENGTTTADITNGTDGINGQDGQAATIAVGAVTTGLPTDPASVTNVGTSSDAIFDFTIPKGDKGDTGSTGATGNGVVNTEYISSSGLVDTYHINYTNGNYDTFTVTNGANGTGSVADVRVNNVSVLTGDIANITVDQTYDGTSANAQSGVAIETELNARKTDYYGTSSTSASTQTKAVTCAGFTLKTGVSIRVKFTNAQSYNGQPKLNVNNTGAIYITLRGTTAGIRYMWNAGEVVDFTYDGTSWIWERGGTATTTYYGVTKLSSSLTSTSTAIAATPSTINSAMQNIVTGYPPYSASETYAVGDRVRYSSYAWECTTAITVEEAWDETHWTKLDTLQTQINNKQATLVSGTNIKTINNNSILGSGNLAIDSLPSQTGQSGKFLTTDGTDASWATVTTPTVNDATLTITQDSVSIGTFTANASSNATINIDLSGKADIDLSNISATGILKIAKEALGSIHYDQNDFTKIGAFWGVSNLMSGTVSLPPNGLWLTFLYEFNANGTASDIGSQWFLGISQGGDSITASGSYPHWYWFGIRIKE